MSEQNAILIGILLITTLMLSLSWKQSELLRANERELETRIDLLIEQVNGINRNLNNLGLLPKEERKRAIK